MAYKNSKNEKKLWNYSNQVLVQSLDFLHAVKTSFFFNLKNDILFTVHILDWPVRFLEVLLPST